jgi:hypothetical protein
MPRHPPCALTHLHTPKTFASKDTRYQATTNQEIITTTTHHRRRSPPEDEDHHPAMHREMLASTVQFSRDNQALGPHQHPPDTTDPRQQPHPQETTHPTTNATTTHQQPVWIPGPSPDKTPNQPPPPTPPRLRADQPAAAAAPGPSGPNSVPSTPTPAPEPVPHPTPDEKVSPPTESWSRTRAGHTDDECHVDVPPSSPTLDTYGRESGTHPPPEGDHRKDDEEVC